jgi:hypothetical protein
MNTVVRCVRGVFLEKSSRKLEGQYGPEDSPKSRKIIR